MKIRSIKEAMKGKIEVSFTEKSMASSLTTTTTTTSSTEESEGRENNCYFPGCRKDANCSCEICIDSINATLDLMPLSVQKSSLTRISYASHYQTTVESTPTSFDPTTVTTPKSISRPISKVAISPPKKKKLMKKSKVSEVEEPMKTTKKERKLGFHAVLKLVLVLVCVLCLELGFCSMFKGVLKPKFTKEIVMRAGERSQIANLRLLEDELESFVSHGKLWSCRASNSKWKINQDGLMLNSKCVLYKSAIEEVSIWGWPLQTSGLFRTGFSSRSLTVLSGRVTEWSDGKFGYSLRKANTSWGNTKWSKSVMQLDSNTWVLEYNWSSVMDSSSLLKLVFDVMKHMMFEAVKNVDKELFSMLSTSENLYSKIAASKGSSMTPT